MLSANTNTTTPFSDNALVGTQAAPVCYKHMACFLQSLLPFSPLLLWPAFGLLAADIAKAKGCMGIKYYLILGPFGYLASLAMPDLKSQKYLKIISERIGLETELQSIIHNQKYTAFLDNQ